MKLFLSRNDPRNTTLSLESGQAVYNIDTPFKLLDTRVSTISKVKADEEHGSLDMRGQFVLLAEIEWHTFTSSRVRFRGTDVGVDDLFRRVGFAWRDRAFVGEDNREYRWKLSSVSKLYLNDSSETPIARFHRSSLGILGPSHPPYLEIFPRGEHMVDTIVVTFVYIEKIRRDKERSSSDAAGGGGAGGC